VWVESFGVSGYFVLGDVWDFRVLCLGRIVWISRVLGVGRQVCNFRLL